MHPGLERPLNALQRFDSPKVLLGVGYLCLALFVWRSMAAGPGAAGPIGEMLTRTLPAAAEPGPRLTFVFSPLDCPECLELAHHWNLLHRAGRAAVVGIAVAGAVDSASAQRLGADLGFRFPVVPGSDPAISAALLALGQDTTPITVLSDLRMRPVLIVPPLRERIDQALQAEIVDDQIGRLLERRGGG